MLNPDITLLFDPLFHLPFITGLLLAPAAAIIGVYLRLRNEWLAALAYSKLAAAGGILAAALNLPVMLGALLASGVLAGSKGFMARIGNDHFVIFILLGWSMAIIAASLSANAEMLGQSLIDGQLYFIASTHLMVVMSLLIFGAGCMPWLSRRLLLAHFFPDHFSANAISMWRHNLFFDLFVVAAIVVMTTIYGVMAAFALLFIPPWIAWGLARGWRLVLLWAVSIAVTAYILAFVLAIVLDQPFGPMMVITLIVFSLLRLHTYIPKASLNT